LLCICTAVSREYRLAGIPDNRLARPIVASPNIRPQRVFYVLKRTRLSRHCMIWLLPLPLPSPTPISKFSLFLILPVFRPMSRRREGGGNEPNHTTARKPGPLQSINYSLMFPIGRTPVSCTVYRLTK
jgi:hypothetical protein